jgi:transcription-repair coupling factor (superfamily II helicase)
LEKIKEKIFQSGEFRQLNEKLRSFAPGERLELRNVAGSLIAFTAVNVFESAHRQVLLVASDEDRAEKLRDDCALLLGEQQVRFFGAKSSHHGQSLDVSTTIAQIEALKALSGGATVFVVASPQSIAERLPDPKAFRRTIIEIVKGKEYAFQQLVGQIDQLGFERKDFVGGYGEYAVRGGIIDLFPFFGENPIRIEFWGDTAESIREFDVLSQRSIRELQSASIVPSLTTDETDSADEAQIADGAERRHSASVFEYLAAQALIVLDEPEQIEREIDEAAKEHEPELFSSEQVFQQVKEFPVIVCSSFSGGINTTDVHAQPQPAFNGNVNILVESLRKLFDDGYSVYLTSDTKAETDRLNELILEAIDSPQKFSLDTQNAISESTVDEHPTSNIKPTFISETIHSGFIYPSARIAIFTEHEIFNRLKRRGLPMRRRFKGISQKELQQLKRGDYVVHVDHGIGTFSGLTKINVAGGEQEVLKLLFLENDVLYVNLNFVNRVQKYSSQDGHVPKLTRLGTGEWDRMRERAKKRIKDIARDIITLYARRKQEQGFAFSSDTHWQKELEASFMYEDTLDQARATLDVKSDMESPAPMDRLICGDVGFGKTEVAVRAAFKAVMDGKQVAILVPTTILALQHFNTFQDRLSRYTTRIENMTRFKSVKEQKRIVETLKHGAIDIIIGTHRILSKDIAFKDLGLLIIDEEHRFGVAAKEKLRQWKASVDTLAMTATPIPRTLHFSLIGARDLSLINTPPRNRIPIITEIIPADTGGKQTQWKITKEAILKELHRGGQVYVIHDRVSNIDAIAHQIRTQVPEAKVHVAHGQMSGHELEKTMLSFLEKKYDVLVCTKIIESGVDIPSVNTIIINRADMFGLAELYQLRGRVGRSNVQAYCYLLTPPLTVIPKQTLRRLQAIEEFTELGSGFNLAMRDLEIRGAGNLLGGEQSGFIMDMGFEMYERIVREAVEELRQEEFKEVSNVEFRLSNSKEAVVESDIEALIPDLYIESDAERLDVYRRLYAAKEPGELQAMRTELRDRFGEFPEEVEHLIGLVELRLAASSIGMQKVSLRGDALTLTMPEHSDTAFYGTPDNTDSPFQRIMKLITGGKISNVQLKQEGKALLLVFAQTKAGDNTRRLSDAKQTMGEIIALLH